MNFEIGKDAILQPIYTVISKVRDFLPGFMWFIVIVGTGYLVAAFVGFITRKILYKIKVDKRLRSLDLHDSLGDISIAKILSIIAKWYVFILFLDSGVDFLSLGGLSRFVNNIVDWLPAFILSLAIIIAGLILIDFIVHKMLELKNKYILLIANIIKAILIIVMIFTAIEQLGIKTDLAQNIFLMVVASILITFSLAFGIGLGLGLKEEVKPLIRKYKRKLR